MPDRARRSRYIPPTVRHNRRRRDLNPAIRAVCALVFLAELALLLLANPYLRVKTVQIGGLQTLDAAQVAALSQIRPGGNLFLTAFREPFARRLTTDPVIERAETGFKLPDTVTLTITERHPYALLKGGNGYWLLDRKQIPYRRLAEAMPGLPILAPRGLALGDVPLGQPLHAAWLSDSYRLLGLLAKTGGWDSPKIEVDQTGNLCLNSKAHLQIRLGQSDFLPQKVALVQAALPHLAGRAEYMDVSCPTQPVYKPRASFGSPLGIE